MLVPFVAQAISPLVVNPRPPWLRPTLALTIIEFKDDITSHLRLVGGGSFGNVLIAPNNWLQYGNVRERLKEIELDPFIQECMAAVPVGSTLGTCAQINEKANVRGEPLGRVPPQAPNTRLILD